jgi:hypothetical protein
MKTDIITLAEFLYEDAPLNITTKIISKVCSKCFVEKPLEEYYAEKKSKFGVRGDCKCCNAIYRAGKNREETAAKKSIYYAEHKEERATKAAIYYAEHKEEIDTRNAIYRAEHKEEINAKAATPEVRAIVNARQKERNATDPLYKLSRNTRSLIKQSIKRGGFKKNTKTADILGCTFEEFQIHIENRFTEGMTWKNQGDWHIDHFFPVSWASNEEQFYKLNGYANLRPLNGKLNRIKWDKAPYIINESTGEIMPYLECDREYITTNLERLESFRKEFEMLA